MPLVPPVYCDSTSAAGLTGINSTIATTHFRRHHAIPTLSCCHPPRPALDIRGCLHKILYFRHIALLCGVCQPIPLPGRGLSKERESELGHDAGSDFEAYVALAAMIIGHTHLEAIPNDTPASPTEMASGDTKVHN